MQKRILVVDDQPAIRRLIVDVLEMQGYQLDSAANGIEAISKVQAFRPDLMLIDMKMPGLTGIETLAKLKEKQLPVKAILLTAYDKSEFSEKARELTIVDYLSKPFDIMDLIQLVEKSL